MKTLARLGAGDLIEVMVVFRDALGVHKELINRLNVYPVPDGDTGTNMFRTLESVVRDVSSGGGDDMASVASALAHGSLMGARGNSGVILSQILRGLAKVAGASEGIDGDVMATALAEAARGAYQAVQNPVEGTILTVIRRAAEAVADGQGGNDLVDVAGTAREAAAAALIATTEMLPALRAAGVVDSGGAGLLLWFDALLNVVDGRPLPALPVRDPGPGGTEAMAGDRSSPGSKPAADSGPRYEVMHLLEAPDAAIDGFRRAWSGMGESIVVVGGDGLYNCHIHTDDIGAAIDAAIDVGRPRQIRVSDLLDEVEEERWVRSAVHDAGAGERPAPDGRTTAVVAVGSGEGIRKIFESLGVTTTVSGGQSMNPSTAEILAAVDAAPATEVILLPNNSNIVAVAETAAGHSAKVVRVVPTRGIPEGFAALLGYDPELDAAGNATAMTAAAEAVAAGEVTRAVRRATTPAGEVREGDWLGITRAGIAVVAADAFGAATALLDLLVDNHHHEVATIIVGDGAEPGETARITDWLAQHRSGVISEVHQGDQPLYPYLFGVD